MKRTVLKCDSCDTTLVDQHQFSEGTEVVWREHNKKGSVNWKTSLAWQFCKPCSIKVKARLVKKYGEGATDDPDY